MRPIRFSPTLAKEVDMIATVEWMLLKVFPILALADWEVFLNPSLVVLVLPLNGPPSVFPREEIAYKVTSLFPSMRRCSAVIRRLKYNALSFALPAMGLAVNQGLIPRLALIVAAQGR